MTHSVFGVLYNPTVKEKLAAELKEAFPNLSEEMTLQKLEQLPYLVWKPSRCLHNYR